MTIITEWVMQIIIFMLIGTIIELLLPNHSMKKYIHLVVGLLLLIILAKPILYLFQVDIVSQFNKFENVLFQSNDHFIETENLLEMQKKEIQAEQDAYIWNEVKLQLMKEANPILEERFSVQIADLAFSLDGPFADNYDNLEQVLVTVKRSTDENNAETEMIEPIIIETDEGKETDRQDRNDRKLGETLEELWGLDRTKIHIMWEGGTT